MNRGLVVLHRLADHSQIVLAIAVVLIVAFGAVLSIRQGNRVKSLDEPSFFDIGKNIGTHFRFAHTKSPEGELRPTADRAQVIPSSSHHLSASERSMPHCGPSTSS